jgi:hypothetical protein
MEQLNMEWLMENIGWVFSGIGVFVIALVLRFFIKKKNGDRIGLKQETTGSLVSNQAAGNINNTTSLTSRDHILWTQKSGNHSTTVQGGPVVIHQGISYENARSIALEVYDANIVKMSEEAAQRATRRAEHLTERFLSNVRERYPGAIGSMQDPGMQMALFSAQKEYARSGDADLESLLIDILVERAKHNEQSLDKIVLDESLTVVPKLTIEHLDALTVNFLLIRSDLDFEDIEQFCNFIEDQLIIFSRHLTKKNSCYEHLEYAKCGSIMRVGRWAPIDGIIRARWPRLFIDANNSEHCGFVLEKIKTRIPELHKLFDVWENSQLSQFDLTTVGVSVAKANYRRITGIKLDSRPPAIEPYVDGGVV